MVGLARESVVPVTGEEYMVDLSTVLHLAEGQNPTIALGARRFGRRSLCSSRREP